MDSDSPFAALLDTNYVPTPSELDAIQQLLGKKQLVVDVIDAQIAELERRKQELEAVKGVHIEYIAKHHRLTTIVRRLPTDILCAIFLTSLSLSRSDSSGPPSLTISHVCRQWRSLALDMPRLWTQIDISLPQVIPGDAHWSNRWMNHMHSRFYKVLWFVSHAGQCPLEVSFRAVDPDDGICNAITSTEECAAAFLSPMVYTADLCRVHAWQSLHIHIRANYSKPLSLPFLRFFNSFKTHIPTLILDIAYSNGQAIDQEDLANFEGRLDLASSRCSSLTARLWPSDCSWIHGVWESLTSLSLGLPVTNIALPPVDVLNILSVTPNLTNLSVEFPVQFGPPLTPSVHGLRVSLPKLRSLTLFGDTMIEFAHQENRGSLAWADQFDVRFYLRLS
ncbi:hypothetical protein NMY22_g3643 [Coprinellus aureogranulatus]|nr:hypothetical protein NMY22_g3643 [Coprinellus aureogranulatus]